MKERLTKLVLNGYLASQRDGNFCADVADIADYLLANGVIAPPVKVGDVVWVVDYILDTLCVFEYEVNETMLFHLMFHENECFGWGKTVFATKKEAKRALAEREKHERKID